MSTPTNIREQMIRGLVVIDPTPPKWIRLPVDDVFKQINPDKLQTPPQVGGTKPPNADKVVDP